MKISAEARALLTHAKSVASESHATVGEVLQAQQTAELSAVCQAALEDREADKAKGDV